MSESTVGCLNPAVFPMAAGRNEPYGESRATSNTTFLHPSISVGPTRQQQSSHSPPNPRSQPSTCPASPYDLRSLSVFEENTSGDEDDIHFTLKCSIDPLKFAHLFHLKPALMTTNYTLWTANLFRSLRAVSLHIYLNIDFIPEDIVENRSHNVRWNKANDFVCSVLTTCMSEEVQSQIGHIMHAAEMWAEARHLYAGTMATDWTLTITALVTTRYTDGEDTTEHIAKMKAYHRDLILMQHDIADELFACFLCISMPSTWNYVFTTLPNYYTSAEVERCIRDKSGICMSQAAASSFHANKTKKGHTDQYCSYHKLHSHRTENCHAKEAEKQKGKAKEDKDGEEKPKEKSKEKGKAKPKPNHGKRANQAVADNDSPSNMKRSDSDLSAYLTGGPSRSRFGWILNGGSTNHICTERSAFATFTPTNDSIKGIVKDGPELQVLGTGAVIVTVSVKGRPDHTIKLVNVSYCPDAQDNLMSKSRMDCRGMEITKRGGRLTIKKPNGEIVMEGCLR